MDVIHWQKECHVEFLSRREVGAGGRIGGGSM